MQRPIVIGIFVTTFLFALLTLLGQQIHVDFDGLRPWLNRVGLGLQVLSFVFLTPQLLSDEGLRKFETSIEKRLAQTRQTVHIFVTVLTEFIFFGLASLGTALGLALYISNIIERVQQAQVSYDSGAAGLDAFSYPLFLLIVLVLLLLYAGPRLRTIWRKSRKSRQRTRLLGEPVTGFEAWLQRQLIILADDRDLRNRWTTVGIGAFFFGTLIQFIAV